MRGPVTEEGGVRGCRRSSRGCCLGCVLILLMLAGGLIAGWYFWGRPWIARQLALVDHAVPGLGVVVDLARGHSPFAVRSLPELQKGRGDSTAFPSEVWLPESRYDSAHYSAEGIAVAVFNLPAGDEAASTATWRREMSARGWSRTPVPDPPDGTALLFEREGARCSVELIPAEQGVVRVWIRFEPNP